MSKLEADVGREAQPKALRDTPKIIRITKLDAGGGALRENPLVPVIQGQKREPESPEQVSISGGEVISPEKTAVHEFAIEIQRNLSETIGSLLKVANSCARADATLSLSQKEALLRRLRFTSSTFSKLAKIGRSSFLQQSGIEDRLPASWTILYMVASLKEVEFNEAVKEKIIHPDMTRVSLCSWLSSRVALRPSARRIIDQPVAALEKRIESPVDSVRQEEDQEVIQAALDHRPLSPSNKLALDALEAAWHAASDLVREKFKLAHDLHASRGLTPG